MSAYIQLCEKMRAEPSTWLVTGVAGFIGSNLLEHLLKLGQTVVGLDNFLTGYQKNLDMVEALVGPEAWSRFTFIEGDIRDLDTCRKACEGVDHVLHEAALGSVPRSIDDPILSNSCNITGYLNMLVAARDAGVKSFVYAASSSTYGDSPELPKVEDKIGNPLSPYAVTKYVDELYADVFARCYGFTTVGLRYFNVFGQRQDPYGAYAAVIPQWFASLLKKETVFVNGDGETSRDFCYIDNVVQANLLASFATDEARNMVYNGAFGQRTTLNELFDLIREEVARHMPEAATATATQAASGGTISIWLDDQMISNPSVKQVIDNGEATISGDFTYDSAKDLADLITAGSLPFEIEVKSLGSISPTMGTNALHAMGIAAAIAMALVVVIMLVLYRLPGLVASIALCGQMAGAVAAITGYFAVFNSFTMTLPGIAGLILSVGIGVDCNVITAEAVREEIRAGKTIDGAIRSGCKGSFWAIFDGNITVLIVSAVLMGVFGSSNSLFGLLFKWLPVSTTGSVYSFGYTLLLGVVWNFIMGVWASRLMLRSVSRLKIFRNPWFYGGERK